MKGDITFQELPEDFGGCPPKSSKRTSWVQMEQIFRINSNLGFDDVFLTARLEARLAFLLHCRFYLG